MTEYPFDAIVLLGGGIGEDGSIGPANLKRLQLCAEVFKQGIADHIVTCGKHGYKADRRPSITEAEAYANYLLELGIPENNIHMETESVDTLSNLLFVKCDVFIPNKWFHLLVSPSANHATERIDYTLRKVLGTAYSWELLRNEVNLEPSNVEREKASLAFTKQINSKYADGDQEAIITHLLQSHPAYGGSKWSLQELKDKLGN